MAEIYHDSQVTRPAGGESVQEEETAAKVVASGSYVAGLCGLGAVVLTILGLSGMSPTPLCSVAVICAGAGLVFEGGAISAKYHDIIAAAGGGKKKATEVESGMSSEMLGGIAGIVLGILALIGMVPIVLIEVSAIVFGATLLAASGSQRSLNQMRNPGYADPHAEHVAQEMVATSTGADVLIGLGAIVLGILGLVGIASHSGPVLALVAILAVGVAELFSGGAISKRMGTIFHH